MDDLQGMRQLMDSLGVLNCQSHHIMWTMRYLAKRGHSIEEYGVLIDEAYTMSCTQVTTVRTITSMYLEREIEMNTRADEKHEKDEGGKGGGWGGFLPTPLVPLSPDDPEQARAFLQSLAKIHPREFEIIMLTPIAMG
jgi:hypothetical protein